MALFAVYTDRTGLGRTLARLLPHTARWQLPTADMLPDPWASDHQTLAGAAVNSPDSARRGATVANPRVGRDVNSLLCSTVWTLLARSGRLTGFRRGGQRPFTRFTACQGTTMCTCLYELRLSTTVLTDCRKVGCTK